MVMFLVKTSKSQVCIPVGCIPPALVAATRCQFWGVCVREGLCPGSVSRGLICQGDLTPWGSLSRGKTPFPCKKND